MQALFDFILGSLYKIGDFTNWLITPLQYINLPPLALFSFTGVAILLGIHLLRLFVGG